MFLKTVARLADLMNDMPDPTVPPPLARALIFAAGTDVGCRREMNQDAWAYGPASAGEAAAETESGGSAPVGLLQQGPSHDHTGGLRAPGWIAVADGMGGARGGEVASRRALQVVGVALADGVGSGPEGWHNDMLAALHTAHRELAMESAVDANLQGMGCTFSGVWWPTADPTRVFFGQVGDSRIYRWRGAEMVQVTRDQTVLQRMIDSGVPVPAAGVHSRIRHVLEYALGADGGEMVPEVKALELQPGDRLVICSDGLHGVLPEEEWLQLAQPHAGESSDAALVADLIRVARERGAPDNVTVVIVRIPR